MCFGVRGGDVADPRIQYLDSTVPVDEHLLELAGPVDPLEVFRFAAPCAGSGCQHFDGTDCKLVDAVVQLPAVVRHAPRCAIRRECRWWAQTGLDACLRCPMVVTSDRTNRVELREAATPVPARPEIGGP